MGFRFDGNKLIRQRGMAVQRTVGPARLKPLPLLTESEARFDLMRFIEADLPLSFSSI
jgi:hypothetical protein